MARLNIEDCWWTDPRRERLVERTGSLDLADIVAVKAWRLAQDFWKHGKGLVPKMLFDQLKHAKDLIEVCLAEVKEDCVYVRGSADHHAWLVAVHAGASAGGKRSASRPRDAQGRLKKSSKLNPSPHQAKSKLDQVSSSSSSSSSNTKKIHMSSGDDEYLLLGIWNLNRGTLPEAKDLTDKRKRPAAARWRDKPDAQYWMTVVQKLAASPFCRGETGGTWVATFDFLIRPDTHIKAMEGAYDRRSPKTPLAINTKPLEPGEFA